METQYSEFVTQTELLNSQINSFYKGFIIGVAIGAIVVFLLGLPTFLYAK